MRRRSGAAVLIVVAFSTGVVWGVTRGELQARQTTRVFSESIGMMFNYVKSGQTAAFERVMTRVGDASSSPAESVDRRRQAAGWKVYKATEPPDDGVVLYYLRPRPR